MALLNQQWFQTWQHPNHLQKYRLSCQPDIFPRPILQWMTERYPRRLPDQEIPTATYPKKVQAFAVPAFHQYAPLPGALNRLQHQSCRHLAEPSPEYAVYHHLG